MLIARLGKLYYSAFERKVQHALCHGGPLLGLTWRVSIRFISSVSTSARLTKGANQGQEGPKEDDEWCKHCHSQNDGGVRRPGIGLKNRVLLHLNAQDLLSILLQLQDLLLHLLDLHTIQDYHCGHCQVSR